MGVILTQDITDNCRTFLIRPVRVKAQLMHRIKDPAMNWFEPIPHIRQCALHNYAHRIIEKRLAHFLLKESRQNSFSLGRGGHSFSLQFCQKLRQTTLAPLRGLKLLTSQRGWQAELDKPVKKVSPHRSIRSKQVRISVNHPAGPGSHLQGSLILGKLPDTRPLAVSWSGFHGFFGAVNC